MVQISGDQRAQPQGEAVGEFAALQLPQRPAQRATDPKVTRFLEQLGDIEDRVAKTLNNPDIPEDKRLQQAASKNVEEVLKAAKVAGLGEFSELADLHSSLLKNQNVLLIPSFDLNGKKPAIVIEAFLVKPVELSAEEVEQSLSEFTKTTDIKSPGAQRIYIQQEVLHDQAPERGASANYGSSGALSGTDSFILINRDLITKNEEKYEGDKEKKERTVLANELVTVAFNEQYPGLMDRPLQPFMTYKGQNIAPIHVVELASDYASLSNGENVVDAFKRMASQNSTYLLSNLVAAGAIIAECQKSEKLMREMTGYLREGVEKKRDPGTYAADKLLRAHPELHETIHKSIKAEMESILGVAKVGMDVLERRGR